MGLPSQLDEEPPAGITDALAPVGALGTFVVPAAPTALSGGRSDFVVPMLLVLIVVLVAVRAGGVAAVSPAVMAAFSFDFLHIEPIRVLHLRTLILCLALFVVIGFATGTRRPPRLIGP